MNARNKRFRSNLKRAMIMDAHLGSEDAVTIKVSFATV